MQEDNRSKLLKIQTSLLGALTQELNRTPSGTITYEQVKLKLEDALNKYEELVTAIDKENYKEITRLLIAIDAEKNSLEEELNKLENFENKYNQFIQTQNSYKTIYQKYSNKELLLSPSKDENIEKLLKRKHYIKGYLDNRKNLNDTKIKLEDLNKELIRKSKIHEQHKKALKRLDNGLLSGLNTLEGRVSLKNGLLEYTTIKKEYEKIDVNINNISDIEALITKYSIESEDNRQKAKVANISYNAMPTSDKLTILNDIVKESYESDYKLIMLQLLKRIIKNSDSFEDAIRKRYEIKELLNYRSMYINKLGIHFSVDPFARIDLHKEIKELEEYSKLTEEITSLKQKIASISEKLETLSVNNNEYIIELGLHIPVEERKNKYVVKEDISFDNLKVSTQEEKFVNNQLKKIEILPYGFKLHRSREKSQYIIKRISSLLSRKQEEIKNKDIPELVIEQRSVKPKLKDSEVFSDSIEKIFANEDIEPTLEEKKLEEQDIFLTNIDDVFETSDEPSFEENADDFSKITIIDEQEKTSVDVIDSSLDASKDELETKSEEQHEPHIIETDLVFPDITTLSNDDVFPEMEESSDELFEDNSYDYNSIFENKSNEDIDILGDKLENTDWDISDIFHDEPTDIFSKSIKQESNEEKEEGLQLFYNKQSKIKPESTLDFGDTEGLNIKKRRAA